MFMNGQFYHGCNDTRDNEIDAIYKALDTLAPTITSRRWPTKQVRALNYRLTALGVPLHCQRMDIIV